MTNRDRIKNMSPEELAEFLDYTNDGDFFVDICHEKYCKDFNRETQSCSGNCKPAVIKWLESEA